MTKSLSNRTWLSQVFFTLTEHGSIRVLDALTTLALIRVMSAEQFGLFSVYQSWVGILLLFLPTLETALYRDYAKLKREGELRSELGAYRAFNFFKVALAILFVAILAFIPQPISSWTSRAAILAFAIALPLSHSFYGFLREPLRFELKQHLVALLSAAQRLSLLGAVLASAHYKPGNILVLCSSAIGIYFLFGMIWSWVSYRNAFKPRDLTLSQTWLRISKVFGTTVVWIHLNGVVNQSIQTLDTFMLSLFHLNLGEIGRYGIALKAANFFQILPVALINSFGVYLGSRDQDHKKEIELVLRYSFFFVGICIVLFILGYFASIPLLLFLGKGKMNGEELYRAVIYFRWQLGGLLILCATYPLSTYLGARSPLNKIFYKVFIPWAVFSTTAYAFAARSGGALLAAKANVLVYGFLAIMLLRFFIKEKK